jgi:hypothetical protein
MGNLASLLFDDDFIAIQFIPLCLEVGWSIADFARLACTSTRSRLECRRIFCDLLTHVMLLRLCQNLQLMPWEKEERQWRMLGNICGDDNPREEVIVWVPSEEWGCHYGIFAIRTQPWVPYTPFLAADVLLGQCPYLLATHMCGARFAVFDPFVRWATRPRRSPLSEDDTSPSGQRGVKRARQEEEMGVAAVAPPAAKRAKIIRE